MLPWPQALRDVKAVLTALEYDEHASYVIVLWQQPAGLASMCAPLAAHWPSSPPQARPVRWHCGMAQMQGLGSAAYAGM